MSHAREPIDPPVRTVAAGMRRVRTRISGEMRPTLSDLAVRPPAMRIVPPPVPGTEPARMRFAREVLDRLDGSVLRYSMRLELYKLARRLGIPIFDANLIIAQAQHHASTPPEELGKKPSTARAWLIPALLVVATQAAIVGAGWAIFC